MHSQPVAKNTDVSLEPNKYDLVVLLKEVISSLKKLFQQKSQHVLLESGGLKMMSLERDSMFMLIMKLLTSISYVACAGAMVKVSVFDCEGEVHMLFEYGLRARYQRKSKNIDDRTSSCKGEHSFTSSLGLDLLHIKTLAQQLSWKMWTGGAVKNRGTRVFLSTAT